MAFHDVRFPTDINYGSEGGPGFATNILKMDSGKRSAVQRWSAPGHSYNAAYNIKKYNTLSALKDFYVARGGPANSFRYKDWADYNSTSVGRSWGGSDDAGQDVSFSDQSIGTGDDSTTQFQLVKRYTSGSQTYVRKITKPVDGTVVVAIDGVEQTTGWSIDLTTGIITFTAAPADGESITAGYEFDVEVTFGKAADRVLSASFDDFGHGGVDEIPLEEEQEGGQPNEDVNRGGGKTVDVTADFTLNFTAFVWRLTPDASGYKAILPALADTPTGLIFVLENKDSGSFSISIYEDTTSLATIGAGEVKYVACSLDGTNPLTANKEWVVFG